MAFVAENGTGLPEANSYVSLTEANAFHTDRANAAWVGDDTVKQAALIRATDYIEQVYGGRWKCGRLNDAQALEWPRTGFDGLPRQLKQAVCMLAAETIGGEELNPTQGRAVKREKVDVLETEYMDNAAPRAQRPAIDGMLMATGWLTGSGAYGVPSNGRVVRV